MPRYRSDKDERLYRAVDRWKYEASRQLALIECGYIRPGEKEEFEQGPLFGETQYLVGVIGSRFRNIDPAPLQAIYNAVKTWYTDEHAGRLPPMAELYLQMDNAVIVLSALEKAVEDRFIYEDNDVRSPFFQRLLELQDAPSLPRLNAEEMARLEAYLKQPMATNTVDEATRGAPWAVRERNNRNYLEKIRDFNKALREHEETAPSGEVAKARRDVSTPADGLEALDRRRRTLELFDLRKQQYDMIGEARKDGVRPERMLGWEALAAEIRKLEDEGVPQIGPHEAQELRIFFHGRAAGLAEGTEASLKTAVEGAAEGDTPPGAGHATESPTTQAAPAEDTAAPSGGGRKAGKEAASEKKTRVWMADYCPVPGCGKPVEYITMTEFERRTGTKGETVKAWILKGAYCHDGTYKVPWCSTHKERTPLGQGAEKPVEPVPKFKPKSEDVRVMWLQCADLLHDRTGLPKPDMDEVNLDVEPTAGSPRELVQAGVTAAIEKAAQLGRMLTKDEIEEIAGPVMKKEDKEEYRSRNHPELRDPRIDFHSAPQRAGAADRDRPKEPPSRRKSSK